MNDIILVTGGTGQLGSHLVERLALSTTPVIVIARGCSPVPRNISSGDNYPVRFIKCDLSSEGDINKARPILANTTVLVHMASVMRPEMSNVVEQAKFHVKTELRSAIHLLKALPKLEHIIFVSSMAVYGSPLYLPVDEICATDPISSYGATKLALEKYLQVFAAELGVPAAFLRYSSIYGPRNRTIRSVPSFIKAALKHEHLKIRGNGTTRRDFIYIDDAVNALIASLETKASGVFNIGSGEGVALSSLAEAIIALTGSRSQIVYQGPNGFDFYYDIERARRKLDFSPAVQLSVGLQREIIWHIRNDNDK